MRNVAHFCRYQIHFSRIRSLRFRRQNGNMTENERKNKSRFARSGDNYRQQQPRSICSVLSRMHKKSKEMRIEIVDAHNTKRRMVKLVLTQNRTQIQCCYANRSGKCRFFGSLLFFCFFPFFHFVFRIYVGLFDHSVSFPSVGIIIWFILFSLFFRRASCCFFGTTTTHTHTRARTEMLHISL